MKIVNEMEKIQSLISESDMALMYVSTTDCNVCKELLPKIDVMLESFPGIENFKVEADVLREIVGKYQIFSVPTAIVFTMGRENIRKIRTFSVSELQSEIDRYYKMIF